MAKPSSAYLQAEIHLIALRICIRTNWSLISQSAALRWRWNKVKLGFVTDLPLLQSPIFRFQYTPVCASLLYHRVIVVCSTMVRRSSTCWQFGYPAVNRWFSIAEVILHSFLVGVIRWRLVAKHSLIFPSVRKTDSELWASADRAWTILDSKAKTYLFVDIDAKSKLKLEVGPSNNHCARSLLAKNRWGLVWPGCK